MQTVPWQLERRWPVHFDAEHDVRALVTEKGWEVLFEAARELWLKVCPLCGGESRDVSDKACSFNLDSGAFRCFRGGCAGGGGKGQGLNIWTLRKAIGDVLDIGSYTPGKVEKAKAAEYVQRLATAKAKLANADGPEAWHRLLLETPAALEWLATCGGPLKGRGLTRETVERFHLGLHKDGPEPKDRRWLTIPYYHDGEPALVKERAIGNVAKDDSRFRRSPAGAPSLMWNADAIAAGGSHVYLCEAEIDAISLEQLGFSPAVAASAGAGAFPDEWREQLEAVENIVIVYDNDAMDETRTDGKNPGEDGARKVAEELGPWRCYRVQLPRKDVNDCLVHYGPTAADEIRKAMAAAKRMGGTGIVHVSEAFDELLADPLASDSGWQTEWDGLNAAIGGIRNELIVVTGDTEAGKTTFCNALLLCLAKAGAPGLMISPEMTRKQIARKQGSMVAGKSFFLMDESERRAARDELAELPVHVGHFEGMVGLKVVEKTIEAFVRRHRGRVVFVDHLDFIMDWQARDERHEINRVVLEVQGWPAKYGVALVLVAHPTKNRVNQVTGKSRRITRDDIRGSAAIKQMAMTILSLDRVGGSRLKVYDEKVRWDGIRVPGAVLLEYDTRTMRYVEVEEEQVVKRPPKGAKAKGSNGQADLEVGTTSGRDGVDGVIDALEAAVLADTGDDDEAGR